MFNAAIAAYRLEKFEVAQSNLVLSSSFLKDSIRKARMFLYLAQTQFRLKDYESSANSFETAIDNALEADNSELAGQILSVYASRLQERASTAESSLKFTLLELSAKQRDKASEYFSLNNLNVEAGTSLVLASKTYQMIKNYEMAINKLELASELYLKDSDYNSAGRALFDVIDLYKHIPSIMNEDIVELSDRAKEVISKISDESLRISLLAKLIREKTKIFETKKEFRLAIQNYEELYSHSLESPLTKELLPVYLAYANLLFQVEHYKKSGDIFTQIAEYMKSIKDEERSKRVLKNANVSYKRAVNAFMSAASVSIHEDGNNEQKAYTYLVESVNLMENVIKTFLTSENENKQWIEQWINSFRNKILLLPENLKQELESKINDLNV